MSLGQPRWYDKSISSTLKSKLGLVRYLPLQMTRSSNALFLGPQFWEILHFSKFLFNIAPRIKYSIPDSDQPARRTLACYVICKDCRGCYWHTARIPWPCCFMHATLTSTASTSTSCLRACSGSQSHLDCAQSEVPRNDYSSGEPSVTTDRSWSINARALSPLSWGNPEVCVTHPSQSPQEHQVAVTCMAIGLILTFIGSFSASLPLPLQEEVLWGHLSN